MAKSTGYRPGQKAPSSGQYGVVDKNGRPKGREVTVTRGEPFPPTQKPGETYTLVDKTKHGDK